jgi:DNA-binding transcriptional MocR family regulator
VSARDPLTAATEQDQADQHDLRIHRAKQLARPVMHDGLKKFIAGFCWHKGDRGMVIYLEGSAEPVPPSEITILEQAT